MRLLYGALALGLLGLPQVARADVNSGLQMALDIWAIRHGICVSPPRYYCRLDFDDGPPLQDYQANHSQLPTYTPRWLTTPPRLSYQQEAPITLSPAQENWFQKRFYSEYHCAPPRIGYDAPDKVLKSIRGW